MTTPCIAIADAVVVAINAATLTQEVAAARKYVPKFDLHSSDALQIAVVPKTDSRQMASRGRDVAEIAIDVGVMKKLQGLIANEIAEIDALLALCEEIKALLNRTRLDNVEHAICRQVQHDPIYSVTDIDEMRTFLTVMTFTFSESLGI